MPIQTAKEALEKCENGNKVVFTLKRNNKPMFYLGNGELWSLTDTYFRQCDPADIAKYPSWEPLAKGSCFWDLLWAAAQGKPFVEFQEQIIKIVRSDETTLRESTAAPVNVALTVAGQVAQALATAMTLYIDKDQKKADEAHRELIWIAKRVAWESNSQRHEFAVKPKAIEEDLPKESTRL